MTAPGDVITEQLVVDADRAMYEAKAAGGNAHHLADHAKVVRLPASDVAALDVRPAG